MSFGPSLRRVACLLVAAIATACSSEAPPMTAVPPSLTADSRDDSRDDSAVRSASSLRAVLAGNAQAVAAAAALVPPGAPVPPFIEARLYAITNIAMHDALNGIARRYERYADTGPSDRQANAAVAVLTAAHDAIVGAAPASQAATDAWYADEIAPHLGVDGYAAGAAIGSRAAAAILADRADDGTAGGGVAPYTPGTGAGDYRFTFPFNTPGFDFFNTGGFADGSVWGSSVRPFVVESTTQFRARPPYGASSNAAAVQTSRYTADFNEVKSMGCAACPARSSVQTEIALFWAENSPTGWNRFTRAVADGRNLDAWETARLLALLQMGEFDVYATNLESKYHYAFWRPVTAVAMAESDGNPNTSTVAGWEVIGFPTPPVPDYPSAHASAGGSAAAIIESVVRGRGPSVRVTSGSLPGVTRAFKSAADAAEENALSRIYIGFHFRHAVEVGLAQGRQVGEYVAEHALRPRR